MVKAGSSRPGPDVSTSPNVGESRDHTKAGKFAKGNQAAKQRKYHDQVGILRRRFLATLTPDELEAVVRSMIQMAKAGDVHAASLLMDKGLGRFADTAEGDELPDQTKHVVLHVSDELREEMSRPLVSQIVRGEAAN